MRQTTFFEPLIVLKLRTISIHYNTADKRQRQTYREIGTESHGF